MNERKLEIQVGIVFVLAVVILILGVLWFKNYRYRGENTQVTVTFPKTSGLIRGDPVEVLGVPSGQVSAIRHENGEAVVVLDLDKDVKLFQNTEIVLENVGIMGQKMVAIYPGGGGPPLEDLDKRTLQGTYQQGVTELMSDLGGTLEAFDRLAKRLDRIFESLDKSDNGSIERTLQNTEQVTNDLAEFLRQSRGDLSVSVHNLRMAMEDVHQSLDGREEAIGQMLDRANALGARLDTTAVNLNTTLSQFQRIMTDLESGNGTFGKMMTDNSLHDELMATLKEARTLVDDIQKNPKKYVKLSLF